MDLRLSGLKALVTGSTRGIGKEIARALLRESCEVIISGRNQQNLELAAGELAAESRSGQIETCLCDFSQEESVAAIAESLKSQQLDILVCNVGDGRSVPPLTEKLGEWNRMMEINLHSATLAIQYLGPLLKASGNGSICLISSICGIEALGAPIPYSVAKASVIALAKNLAGPLAHQGVRINVVSPGNIEFPGSVWEQKMAENSSKVISMLHAEVPMQRFGTPDEIANAVTFLVSPVAGFITGANLVVDGGQTRRIG